LLEAKSQGLIELVEPLVGHLRKAGMWVTEDVRRRVRVLAGEA
jgi:hypothetical protein